MTRLKKPDLIEEERDVTLDQVLAVLRLMWVGYAKERKEYLKLFDTMPMDISPTESAKMMMWVNLATLMEVDGRKQWLNEKIEKSIGRKLWARVMRVMGVLDET